MKPPPPVTSITRAFGLGREAELLEAPLAHSSRDILSGLHELFISQLSRYSAEKHRDFTGRLPRDPGASGLAIIFCAETTRSHLTHIEAFHAIKVVERSIVLQYLSQEREVSRGIHAEIVRVPPKVIKQAPSWRLQSNHV